MGGLFKSPKPVRIPTPVSLPPQPVIPEPDEEEQKRARRRVLARRMAGSGRASTILSDISDGMLGG